MKRIMVLLMILLGFVLAGCEEEEHERHYGYRDRGYRDGYYGREYRGGYYEHGYRPATETTQADGTGQAESTLEP